jgi:signal transduction histidine kinase/DNA-binding response OmpR family regulator
MRPMFTWLLTIASPDEDVRRRGRNLVIMMLGLIIMVLTILLIFVFYPNGLRPVISAVISLLAYGGTLALARSGRVTLSAVIMLGILIMLICGNIVRSGVLFVTPYFLILLLLIASLTLRPWQIWPVLVVLLGALGAATLTLPSSVLADRNEFGILATSCLLLGVVALMSYLGARSTSTALEAARSARADAEAAAQALSRANATLEATVAARTAALQTANAELQRAKSAADAARHAAEEANQFKTQFLANMSHELRTPLNAIINFTDFIGKKRYGTLNERQRELQQRVIHNADHLLGLINDILDLSKIEAGRMDLFREPTDLDQVLRGVMSTAVGLTKGKGLELELEVPDELPEVYIDKQRIRQVLLNLLSNAAKFTEQGRIIVRATLVGEQMVELTVRDTGIGIPPECQHLVFEEFRQVDGELTRQHQGTGLGMPISKRLVELHGGQMWLESTPGVGTTFFFTIPIHQASTPTASVLDVPPAHAAPMVVVVDDDLASQQILQLHLDAAGYTVHVVGDSRQALPTIIQLQPQLVILDLLMPHKDGWEILAELRTNPATADIPVVLCSIVEEQGMGLALGANDYLVKPVRADRLHATIQRWLRPAASVLVIDDDGESRQLLRALLEEAQYQVREADNGRSGLAAVQSATPDLVVLDLMMPELDGFQVLAELRADPNYTDLPVIVVTAKELTAHEQVWLRERAQQFVQKGSLAHTPLLTSIQQILSKEPDHVMETL